LLATLVSCGGASSIAPADDEGSSSTDADTSGGTSSAGDTPSADDTSSGTGPADADLCVQWCIGAEARGCAEPFVGETCYTRCLNSIEYAIEDGCVDEHREVLECEAEAGPPAEVYCESLACEAEYKRDDLCRGSCGHLGGSPGSGGSQETCNWRGTSCYGHDFEAICPVGDATGACDCLVDDAIVAQCDVGVELVPLECDDEIHVFTTCCGEVFAGVLLP
jgi:hypothetical protein